MPHLSEKSVTIYTFFRYENHLMENIIYNELRSRGYNVDVGMVETMERNLEETLVRKRMEEW